MAERKRRTSEQLKSEIMKYLKNQTFPRTTGQIADAVGLNWYSTTNYLMELKSDGELFHEKVGRQNQWWIEHVGDITKEVRKSRKKLKEQDKRIEELEKEVKDLKKRLTAEK